MDIERRFSEEPVAALLLQSGKPALDAVDARPGHIAVGGAVLFVVLRHVVQHGAQILQIQKQQTLVVRDPEHDRQDVRLHLCQIQQPCQKRRSHLTDRRAQRQTHFPKNIPEAHRIGAPGKARLRQPHPRDPLPRFLTVRTRAAHSRQIALHIRQKNRHARVTERFRHHLQRNRLAGPGRPRDQPVAVGHPRQNALLAVSALTDPYRPVIKHTCPLPVNLMPSAWYNIPPN